MSRHTKEAIMDVAESLFASRGFKATSLREITAQAGVNLAAVNYHFGGKVALLEAVYARRIEVINRVRLSNLAKLRETHGERQIPVGALVEAFVSPAMMKSDSVDAPGLLGRCYMEPQGAIRQKVRDLLAETWGPYLEAFEEALGEQFDRDTLRDRMRLMNGLLAFCMVDPDSPELMSVRSDDGSLRTDAVKQVLVGFLVNGMSGAGAKIVALSRGAVHSSQW